MPDPSDIDLEGLDYDKSKLAEALKIDVEDWKKELLAQDELFIKLHGDLAAGDAFPARIVDLAPLAVVTASEWHAAARLSLSELELGSRPYYFRRAADMLSPRIALEKVRVRAKRDGQI
jgi:hypothetical protein